MRLRFLILLVASMFFYVEAPFAQTATVAQCTSTLQNSRNQLRAIQAQLTQNGLTLATTRSLVAWRDEFQAGVQRLSLRENLESMGVGIGGSLLATGAVTIAQKGSLTALAALGGPAGVAAAALGTVMGLVYVNLKNELFAPGSPWGRANTNTAFYQYILDYAEYGRVGDVTNSVFQDFVTVHRQVLTSLVGSNPPTNPSALNLYMQAHSNEFLLFFGFFEEEAGATIFPRWRFPQTQGRYGFDRLGVGYFRKVLAANLVDGIQRLDAEIAILQQQSCNGGPLTISACGAISAGTTARTCFCDVTSLSKIWGTDLYSNDSSICTAAVHAGLVVPRAMPDGRIAYQGIVQVSSAPGCAFYTSSTANGVTSTKYGNWSQSIYFPAKQVGLCDESSRPRAGQWYCPATMQGAPNDLTCHCSPQAMSEGKIWGTRVYTDDSSVCRAAQHAGAVSSRGGQVRVLAVGPLDSYEGTTANGIESGSYGPWKRSFGFP